MILPKFVIHSFRLFIKIRVDEARGQSYLNYYNFFAIHLCSLSTCINIIVLLDWIKKSSIFIEFLINCCNINKCTTDFNLKVMLLKCQLYIKYAFEMSIIYKIFLKKSRKNSRNLFSFKEVKIVKCCRISMDFLSALCQVRLRAEAIHKQDCSLRSKTRGKD